MATIRSSLPHELRTASEPREKALEPVILANVREVNENIRLFRLNAADPGHTIQFLPGQWLDTFIPGLPKAGGFTITSTPDEARPTSHAAPYLELAVQRSTNPPAQWLWQAPDTILGTRLHVRVGGSFHWPPSSLDPAEIDRLVLIAGGVGVNPLVSILAQLIRSSSRPREIHFVYATKAESDLDRQRILFLPRLMDLLAAAADESVTLSLYLTGTDHTGSIEHGQLPNRTFARRLANDDLLQALDGFPGGRQQRTDGRSRTVCYVCGPPTMTDQIVSFLSQQAGMAQERVLCEKWW